MKLVIHAYTRLDISQFVIRWNLMRATIPSGYIRNSTKTLVTNVSFRNQMKTLFSRTCSGNRKIHRLSRVVFNIWLKGWVVNIVKTPVPKGLFGNHMKTRVPNGCGADHMKTPVTKGSFVNRI